MNTANQLKRIKEMLCAATGFEDDDQLNIDDAHDAIKKLIETMAEQPPQRTWVGLDEEDDIDWEENGNFRDLVEAVEAKLKEKNT